jgi:hypothetical protein
MLQTAYAVKSAIFFPIHIEKKAYCIYNTVEQKKNGREKNGNQE